MSAPNTPEPDEMDDATLEAALGEVGPALVKLLPRANPSPALLDRLMDATLRGGRLDHFADQVASLLCVPRAEAARLLDALDNPESWQPMPLPNISVFPVAARASQGISAFVRLVEGGQFPEHSHLGPEKVLIVSGRCEDQGRRFGPGDMVEMQTGSHHSFTVCPGPDFVALVVVQQGLKFGKFELTELSPLRSTP